MNKNTSIVRTFWREPAWLASYTFSCQLLFVGPQPKRKECVTLFFASLLVETRASLARVYASISCSRFSINITRAVGPASLKGPAREPAGSQLFDGSINIESACSRLFIYASRRLINVLILKGPVHARACIAWLALRETISIP